MLKVDTLPPTLTTHEPDRDGNARCKARVQAGHAVLSERRASTSGVTLKTLRKAVSVRVVTPAPSCPACLKLGKPKRSILPTRKTYAPYCGAWK